MKNYVDSSDDAAMGNSHWQASLRLVLGCLAVWFVVSFGCGILFVDQLNQFSIGGYKVGFWFAQQGSIYAFVALIFYYVWRMNQIDHDHHVDKA